MGPSACNQNKRWSRFHFLGFILEAIRFHTNTKFLGKRRFPPHRRLIPANIIFSKITYNIVRKLDREISNFYTLRVNTVILLAVITLNPCLSQVGDW